MGTPAWTFVATTAGLALAGQAQAQRPDFDDPAWCRGLRAAVAAAGEEPPFGSLAANPPNLGFRWPCAVRGEGLARALLCSQYAGFTSEPYEELLRYVAACLHEMARLPEERGPGYPHRIGSQTRFRSDDASVLVAQTGIGTRRGIDLFVTIGRADRQD